MPKVTPGARLPKRSEAAIVPIDSDLLQGPHEHPNRFEVYRWRVEEFLNQGHMMLLILRNHVHKYRPQYFKEFEHALLCYAMLQVEMDDYFSAIVNYKTETLKQKDIKWWPDTLFTRVALVVFAVLDKVDVQTLDYYVNKDLLKQLFRHLQWENILFNWKAASDPSPCNISTFP